MPFSNSIKIFLEKQIKTGKKDFIIYPYGKIGHEVKRILNDFFNIRERAIIDSENNSSEEIQTTDFFMCHSVAHLYYLGNS